MWGLTCTAVFWLSGCTAVQSKKGINASTVKENGNVFRGKIVVPQADVETEYALARNFQKKKKHRLAVEAFKTAVKSDPGNAAAYNGLGVSWDALGMHDRAVGAYTHALSIDPTLDYVLNNLGYSYLLQNRIELAIDSFRKAVELDRGNQRYLNNLGLAYARLKDYGAAFEAFNANDDTVRAHRNIAKLYYRDGHYQKAAEHFNQAATRIPSDEVTGRALSAAANLAQIHATDNHQTQKLATQSTTESLRQLDMHNHDGFYTIPAGAIETPEIVDVETIETVQNSDDRLLEKVPPIYLASLTRIPDPEERPTPVHIAVKSAHLKTLDEKQVAEYVDKSRDDRKNHPRVRVKIEVSNGNGVRHMARRVGNYLAGKDFILMYLSNADHFNHVGTNIYYTRGYLREAYRLSQALPGVQHLEEVPEVRNGNAAVSVLIGKDLTKHMSLFEQG